MKQSTVTRMNRYVMHRTVSIVFVTLISHLLLYNMKIVYAQVDGENPCQMEIFVYYDLSTCLQRPTESDSTGILIADGQCRTAITTTSTSDPAYTLLPGNYRAQCINSTAVMFIESGCISNQCNATSLLSSATCDRNNSIASSLYSRLAVPEYLTYPSLDMSYTCIEASGSNVTVSFAIFGNCSSPTCVIPTPAPIQFSTLSPTTIPPTTTTTVQPIVVSSPTTPPTVTTNQPNENPSAQPVSSPSTITTPTTPTRPTATTTTPQEQPTQPKPSGPTTVVVPPSTPSNPTMAPSTSINNNTEVSSNSSNSSTLIAGIASGVAFVAVMLAIFLLYRNKKKNSNNNHHANSISDSDKVMDDDFYSNRSPLGPNSGIVGTASRTELSNPNEHLYSNQSTTNEIWVDPNADDVSTLGGGTLPPDFLMNANGQQVQDEPTASVNMDYDFNNNQYRTDIEEDRTQSHYTTSSNPTTYTNLSKLGLLGEADFARDDASFEEQFAELDDNEIRMTNHNNKYDKAYINNGMNAANNNNNNTNISNRVKPFEVRAPPGKLGMVVDTPNGGVPIVRAIKPDSVLNGSVQIGDRLISVDHINVTSMSALEVSNLISLKQHQQRLLIFCRLTPPSP
jgi:hypothetical protein